MRTIAHRLAAVGATAVVIAGSTLAAAPAALASGAAPVSYWTFYHAVPGTTYSSAGSFVTSVTDDAEGDPITIDWLTAPLPGMTLAADGAITWDVPADFCGALPLSYRAFDGTSYGNTTSVDLWAFDLATNKVITCGAPEPEPEPEPAVNTPPVAVSDWYYAEVGMVHTMLASALIAWGDDADGDALSVEWEPLPLAGMTILPDGSLAWPVPEEFCGVIDVQYRLFDGEAHSELATLEFRALGPSGSIPCPEAEPATIIVQHDAFHAAPGQTLSLAAADGPLSNDVHSESAAFWVVSHSVPAEGELVLEVDGSMTWTAPEDFCGATSFTYVVTDGALVSDEATVSIDAIESLDWPVARHCDEEPPVDPADPVDPAEPGDPAEPSDQSDGPARPELPTQPLDPADPADPQPELAATPRGQLALTGAPEQLLAGLGTGALLALLLGAGAVATGVRCRVRDAR